MKHILLAFKYPKNLFFLSTIFLVAMSLRFYHFGRELGGHDENAMLLYFGYAPLKTIVTNYWDANNHIFHTILVKLMGSWFGEENAFAIRSPSLIFGIASLYLIYRLALDLFNSLLVARIALLIAALSPIHIHYSQTARGYGLIIFFSAAMILLSLKVFCTETSKFRGVLITLCGFLSVWTLPTNLYFLFGLATWVLLVLLLPDSPKQFFRDSADRKQKGLFFLKVALGIAFLCLVVYAPVLDQLIETLNNHKTTHTDSIQWQGLDALIPGILEKVFPNVLLIFLPLLILGLFYKNSNDYSYRSLLLMVFFMPFIFVLMNDMRGYPRNYLYNLPLLIVFMAAGMVQGGDFFSRWFNNKNVRKWTALVICGVYCVLSVRVLFHQYYPNLAISGGKEIKKNIYKHTQSHDLIAVQSSQNFIYTRKQYKDNLINIYNDNRIGGLYLVSPKSYNIFKYAPTQGVEIFQLIKRFWGQTHFQNFELGNKNKMTLMTNPISKSLTQKNFLGITDWKIWKGKGKVSKSKTDNINEHFTLRLETSLENEMIVVGKIQNTFEISKPQIVVLVWTVNLNYKEVINQPTLIAGQETPMGPQLIQLKMGRINSGMNVYHETRDSSGMSTQWFLRNSIGTIPPGNYSFSVGLKCNKGQTVTYDGFRVFLIELEDKKFNG